MGPREGTDLSGTSHLIDGVAGKPITEYELIVIQFKTAIRQPL